jgi:CsoR family transcriptional regulator, copper-sensing transcriptional repressor
VTQSATPTYGYAADKAALIKRLHRIEGQVRGIEKMVEQDRYCVDIITQISAITTALDAVAFKILDEHVNHCVAGGLPPATRRSRARRAASCSTPCTASRAPTEPSRIAARSRHCDQHQHGGKRAMDSLSQCRNSGTGRPTTPTQFSTPPEREAGEGRRCCPTVCDRVRWDGPSIYLARGSERDNGELGRTTSQSFKRRAWEALQHVTMQGGRTMGSVRVSGADDLFLWGSGRCSVRL